MKGTIKYINIEEKDIVLGVKERTQQVDEILKSHRSLEIEYKKEVEGETIRVRLETSNRSALLALDLLKENPFAKSSASGDHTKVDHMWFVHKSMVFLNKCSDSILRMWCGNDINNKIIIPTTIIKITIY
ncbi:unnamed protein product [Trichogramma brassicae]|uniref:Uncharacterized protein n=1 Tax=Trichogramma brassicae TaxID=86971 RepID=A0A6H5J2G5_9HYME|nr:unnamed protein product [Trichogramma brassicae]